MHTPRGQVAGVVLADSVTALYVLWRPATRRRCVPPQDVRRELLVASDARGTTCEFKGRADYLDVVVGGDRRRQVAWTYPDPWKGYAALARYVSFYAGRVDAAWLGDKRVTAQEGDLYRGWITRDLVGPFKGGAGTLRW